MNDVVYLLIAFVVTCVVSSIAYDYLKDISDDGWFDYFIAGAIGCAAGLAWPVFIVIGLIFITFVGVVKIGKFLRNFKWKDICKVKIQIKE